MIEIKEPKTNGIGISEVRSSKSINFIKVGTLIGLFSVLVVLIGLLVKPAINRRRMHCLFGIPSLNFDTRPTVR